MPLEDRDLVEGHRRPSKRANLTEHDEHDEHDNTLGHTF